MFTYENYIYGLIIALVICMISEMSIFLENRKIGKEHNPFKSVVTSFIIAVTWPIIVTYIVIYRCWLTIQRMVRLYTSRYKKNELIYIPIKESDEPRI